MSDETKTPATAASAPGKVLLAGGYLVLDRDYTGLAFGLDARIHVVIRSIFPHSGVPLPEIVVRSPQFHDAEWRYGYTMLEEGGGIRVTQLEKSVYLNYDEDASEHQTDSGVALPEIHPHAISSLKRHWATPYHTSPL